MAEAYFHLNGHTYQLGRRYLEDDGAALEKLRAKIDELVRGLALEPLEVDVVIRGDETTLVVAVTGVQSAALGVAAY